MTKKNPTYSAYGCLEDDGRTKLTPIVWKEEVQVQRTILLKHYPSQDTDMATEETGSATIDEPAQKLSRGRFRIAGFATRTLDRKSRARSSHSLEGEGKRVVTKAGTAETETETVIDEPDTAVDQSRTAEPTFKETSTEISSDGTPLKANETPMTDFVMPSKASAKLSDVNFSVLKQDSDDTVSLGSRLFFRGRNDGTNADLDDICASTEEKRSILSRLNFRRKKIVSDNDEEDNPCWFDFGDSFYLFECMFESTPEQSPEKAPEKMKRRVLFRSRQ